MIRFACLPIFVVVMTLVGMAQPPRTDPLRQLVEQLGSPEFPEREAAMKRLDELGPAALDVLRPACQSENPEIARRAQELVRKIERKLINEKTLAPTLVELDVRDLPLDAILTELSKQAHCEVVLAGAGLQTLANQRMTLTTGGKVPFWSAVLKLCEAGGLQLASVGGYLAPGSSAPPRGPVQPGVRFASNPNRAVVLEPRNPKSPRRPAAVHGAVLIEAYTLPPAAVGPLPGTMVQVWPEPRLHWEAITSVKVVKATDVADRLLVTETAVATASPPFLVAADGVVIVRNPDGTARFIRGGVSGSDRGITLNARQGLIQFKAEPRPELVKQLHLSLFGTVRTGIEPLSQATDLAANRVVNGVGIAGVDLRVSYGRSPAGQLTATVELSYDPKTVNPVGSGDPLPGTRGGSPSTGNNTIYGVCITDADGKPFVLGLTSGRHGMEPASQRMVVIATLELHGDREGNRVPARATFWGTHTQAIEVPVTLQNVPLPAGN
jgi:hypothetical protein